MPVLKTKPTLTDIQAYVGALEQERGFAHENVIDKCLLLGEEVGELFKAVRKHEAMNVDARSANFSIEEEMADIIVILCTIANRHSIDLEDAFRKKEEINKTRTWGAPVTPLRKEKA